MFKIVFCIYKKVNCINFNQKKKKSCTKLGEGGLRVCSHNRFFHGISAHSIGFVPQLLQFWTWLPDTFVPVSEMQSLLLHNVDFNSEKMHAVVYSANYDPFSYTYTY